MRNNYIKTIFALITGIIMTSCGRQLSEPTSSITPPTIVYQTIEPASSVPESSATPAVLTNKSPKTVLNFTFPFEPGFPGYIVNIKSEPLTIDLICSLNPGETTGKAVELNASSDEQIVLGTCDTKSMTLDEFINDEITITVILGGHPFIYDVTKSPDRTYRRYSGIRFLRQD